MKNEDLASQAYCAERVREVVGLETQLVGVLFQSPDDDAGPYAEWQRVESHRYCQALMNARHGEKVVLMPDEISCPAAASVFGVASLPEGLASGRGLKGFGIVQEDETGAAMFECMTRLPAGRIARIVLAPAQEFSEHPDVIVAEGPVESLMWLLLADLNLARGRRRTGETAVLQATCVDATLIPCVEGRLNFSLGCYGCREATDMGPGEAVVGFPGAMLEDICGSVEYLAEKAIPKSRSKAALARVLERDDQGSAWPATLAEEGPFARGGVTT
jgi:uncharacterized protein (DUF169 family)